MFTSCSCLTSRGSAARPYPLTARIRARNDDVSEWPEADYTVDSHAELAALLGLDLQQKG